MLAVLMAIVPAMAYTNIATELNANGETLVMEQSTLRNGFVGTITENTYNDGRIHMNKEVTTVAGWTPALWEAKEVFAVGTTMVDKSVEWNAGFCNQPAYASVYTKVSTGYWPVFNTEETRIDNVGSGSYGFSLVTDEPVFYKESVGISRSGFVGLDCDPAEPVVPEEPFCTLCD